MSVRTATVTSVSGATSSTQLFAAVEPNRADHRSVFNDSSAVLYLKWGTGASSTSYTVQVAAGGFYEFPQPLYTGVVHGAWASATGAARCTEAV